MGAIRSRRRSLIPLVAVLVLLTLSAAARAQTTTFTYQGRLVENGVPATGLFDFQFTLYDTSTVGTGTAQGPAIVVGSVQVSGGLFTVPLDYAAAGFPGADRFLEIAVKKPAEATFHTLGPRQPLTSDPYAIRSRAATIADGLSAACVSCVTSTQVLSIQGSQVTGTVPVPSVPAGSGFYVQNGTSAQTAASFNIDGTGSAGTLSASTQFNLGTNRFLAQPGLNTLVLGVNSGLANTTGSANSFVGINAGQNNTTGSSNQFFGFNAGRSTTTGGNNSFFGDAAGINNTNGVSNSYFGALSGFNATGSQNSFFGDRAGGSNTTGSSNSFFGSHAGAAASATSNNAYVGAQAGTNATSGGANSFFGANAGLNLASGASVTLMGANTSAPSGLDHATAIGADAAATASNTIVLGRTADLTQVSGIVNVVGSQVNFAGSRVLANPGNSNLFVGTGAGSANTTAGANTFVGSFAGNGNTTGTSNSFFGSDAGLANTTGKLNSFFGQGSGFGNTGDQNSFFGEAAGNGNQGSFNTFLGQAAGNNSGSGSENVFVGHSAGAAYGSASLNTFVGDRAGFTTPLPANPTGGSNTTLGASANVTAGLNDATAIGANAQVTQSNSVVLGQPGARVGIGNTAPQSKLHITDGTSNVFLGAATVNCGGSFGAVGFLPGLSCNNYALLGGDNDTYINRPSGGSIHFRQNNFEQVTITSGGTLRLLALGSAGGSPLCWNGNGEIAFCSSSLRYKKDLRPFGAGMALINRLRPISFNWKSGGRPDVGLGAEDVARVEPRLVTYNDQGEVEGVKYDHLGVVFINAFKEQQAQIDAQRREIAVQQERLDTQEKEIESLRRLIGERLATARVQ